MSSTPKKITELTAITSSEDTDVIVIVDVSEDESKKQTKGNFLHEVQADIDDHKNDFNNPHNVTAEQIGSSLGILEAEGDIDDENVEFIFLQKPKLICINGAVYRENRGWTWALLTATLSFPVGKDGEIYGII